MTSIQSTPIQPAAPASAPSGGASNADESAADKENGFAEVLRGKQNAPRKEPQGERAKAALPGTEEAEAEAAATVPGLDTSALPPDLAAALAQIGIGHARPATPGRPACEAGTDTAGSDGTTSAARGVAQGATAMGTELSAARGTLPGVADATRTAAESEARPTLGAELPAAGARLARADGVVARGAQPIASQPDAVPPPRFESTLEKAINESAQASRANAGVESATGGPAALPGWAAAAVPVDHAAARAPAAPQHVATVDAPVGSQRFTDQTAQQVTWMVRNGLSEAEIRVKPADMGPISVRIEMNQNEAVINFAVTQPETRAAVQDSLHRLQEMLAESGISLGEANVGGQGQTGQFGERATGGGSRSRVTFAAGGDGIGALAAAPRAAASARGLVDTFA